MNNIQVDKATVTGSSHLRLAKHSEDYAGFKIHPNGQVHLALSDGCSGGQNSDLASRAWVTGALNSPTLNVSAVYQERLKTFSPSTLTEDMATLCQARLSPENKEVLVVIVGDGAYALFTKKEDGSTDIQVKHIVYSHNMPLYPAYLTDKNALASWIIQSIHATKVMHTVAWNTNTPQDVVLTSTPLVLDSIHMEVLSSADINGIVLCSDGIASLKQTALLKEEEALVKGCQELFRIKNTLGQFLTRRLSKQAQEWAKEDNMPTDDLTLVGAYWEN